MVPCIKSSFLKEISPGYSLEGMMLKLKVQYFGHLMQRVDSLEKTLMLGGMRGKRRRGGINQEVSINILLYVKQIVSNDFSSDSRSVVSDSLRPHESQHARAPCPSPTPGVHSGSHPSSP